MTAKDFKIYAYMDVCSLVWSKNHAAKSYKGILILPVYMIRNLCFYIYFSHVQTIWLFSRKYLNINFLKSSVRFRFS